MTAAALPFAPAFYRADPPQMKSAGSIDIAGFALLALGIGSLQYLLERGEHYDWFDSKLIIILAATAVVAIATMIWWELRVDALVLNLRVLKNLSLTSANAQATAVSEPATVERLASITHHFVVEESDSLTASKQALGLFMVAELFVRDGSGVHAGPPLAEDARLAELSAGWYDMVDATAANAASAPARAQDPDVVNGGGPSHRARWSLQSHQGRVAAS